MQVNSDSPEAWMSSGPGAKRRILCQDKALMMVEFAFEKNAEGLPHSHPHVQTTLVAEGQFEFTVSGVTKTLNPGDAITIPSNAVHSCVCLTKGRLVDSFAPRRDDFMTAHGLALD